MAAAAAAVEVAAVAAAAAAVEVAAVAAAASAAVLAASAFVSRMAAHPGGAFRASAAIVNAVMPDVLAPADSTQLVGYQEAEPSSLHQT